ncbi:GNAT family N-acetyltransferase [Streptomyces sp. 4N509B]|uniref:GNAT family N-acetyltransferase n=1 Tax=Streptomyces sp. 4N509B TaxID=3457413 RepID=UPI003FD2C8B3
MRLAIREMTAADAPAVARLRTEGWLHAYADLVPREVLDGMDSEQFAQGLRRMLSEQGPDRPQFVAHRLEPGGGDVVGWAAVGPYRPVAGVDPDAADGVAPAGGGSEGRAERDEAGGRRDEPWGEVYALYVLPGFLGRGVGRSLMGRALDALAAAGRPRARLWVLRDNAPARRFYERAGFRADGAENVITMAGAGVPEVRYAATLPVRP